MSEHHKDGEPSTSHLLCGPSIPLPRLSSQDNVFLSRKDYVAKPDLLKYSIPVPLPSLSSVGDAYVGAHRCSHLCPPKDVTCPLSLTQPTTNYEVEAGASPHDKYEPNSLFSSNQRIAEMSSLCTSGSNTTVAPGFSDSTTTLQWARSTDDRVIPFFSSPKAVLVMPQQNPKGVFERCVEPHTQRTAAIDNAMLAAAATLSGLYT